MILTLNNQNQYILLFQNSKINHQIKKKAIVKQ